MVEVERDAKEVVIMFFRRREPLESEQADDTTGSQKLEGSVLPVQASTFGFARKILEDTKKASGNIDQIASGLLQNGSEVSRRIKQLSDREDLGRYSSSITEESIGNRMGSLWFSVAQPNDENMRKLVRLSLFYLETFVDVLYPENAYVWTETDFDTAKAEVEFGRLILRVFTEELKVRSEELFEIEATLAVMSKQFEKTTYVGQTMRLQSSVAIMQLKLVDQQAKIMDRFDKQDKRMSCMTKVINICSIVAAVATVLSLIVQLWSCSQAIIP